MGNPVSDFFNNLFSGGGGGGDDASDAEAEYQAWLRAERKKARGEVDKTFAPYGLDSDAFAYGDPIRRKYKNYVMNAPVTGINEQRTGAREDLGAALARQGLNRSSTAVDRNTLLDKTYAKAEVDAAEKGDRAAKAVQQNLIKAKAQALADINASTDPAGAASQAMTSSLVATDPGEFKPMYDVFDKITKGLLLRQEVENLKKQKAAYDYWMGGGKTSSARNIPD